MAFQKCATCGQLYMSKMKLAEHISSRHSGGDLELEKPKSEPKPATSNPNSAAARYAALVSRYTSLTGQTPAPRPPPSPPHIVKSEISPIKIEPAPVLEHAFFIDVNCSFCNLKMRLSKMPHHIVKNHLAELKQFILDSALVPPRSEFKGPTYANEVEEDIAYILGEKPPVDEPLPPRFTCPCCRRSFVMATYHTFVLHINRHIRNFTNCYKCPRCQKIYRGGFRLFKEHLKRPPVKCPKCPLSFCNGYDLRLHDVRFHRFICDIPNCTQPLGHQHSTLVKCGFCYAGRVKFFENEGKLQEHVAEFHTRNGKIHVECHSCSPFKVFSTLEAFQAHRRRCHLKFACKHPGCDYLTARPASLASHEQSHNEIKPFRCIRCQKAFKSRERYICHVRLLHSNRLTVKTEPICTCVKDEPQ